MKLSSYQMKLITKTSLVAVHFACLSFSLFKILNFSFASSSLFLLFLSVGFSAGAVWGHFSSDQIKFIKFIFLSSTALLVSSFGVSYGAKFFSIYENLDSGMFINFLKLIFLNTLITFPFFALWGKFEFLVFKKILLIEKLDRYFYLIFIFAALISMPVTSFLLTNFGLLNIIFTFSIIICFLTFLVEGKRKVLIPIFLLVILGSFCLSNKFEHRFVRTFTPKEVGYLNYALTGEADVLSNKKYDEPRKVSLIYEKWNKHNHFSLVKSEGANDTRVLGFYNGIYYWFVNPSGHYDHYIASEKKFFNYVKPNSKILIIGAGGGRQVSMALDTKPKLVVANELIEDVFNAFKGENSSANNHVFLDPRVQTIGGDGLKFLKSTKEKFDLIVLPYTEGVHNNFILSAETARSLHTLESFKIMKDKLSDRGLIIISKGFDHKMKLLSAYSMTMSKVGLHTKSFVQKDSDNYFSMFVLLGSKDSTVLDQMESISSYREVKNKKFRKDHKIIRENSPWIYGMEGILFPIGVNLNPWLFVLIFFVFAFLFFIYTRFINKKKREKSNSFLLSFMVGFQAAYLEHTIIYYLTKTTHDHLFSFIWGTVIFFGLSFVTCLFIKKSKLIFSIYPIITILAIYQGFYLNLENLTWILLVLIGSSLLFPIILNIFKKQLIYILLGDALGFVVGAGMTAYLLYFHGYQSFFPFYPFLGLSSLMIFYIIYKNKTEEFNLLTR